MAFTALLSFSFSFFFVVTRLTPRGNGWLWPTAVSGDLACRSGLLKTRVSLGGVV